MTILIAILAWAVAIAVTVPAVVLFMEVVFSFLPIKAPRSSARLPSLAVIVPAHNEGHDIKATLDDLRAASYDGVNIVVVADNCTDETASVAKSLGVTVIERENPDLRGKGFALQYGVDSLKNDPPECVAFFDADCRAPRDALQTLAKAAIASERPVQALYEMRSGDASSPQSSVSRFAWVLINTVRMRGLQNLFGVTRFTGVGLATPWDHISGFRFGSGAITEDHELTFSLAERRCAPRFLPAIRVTSQLPETAAASVTQRSRWEHGSISVLRRKAIPGLMKAVATRNAQLFAVSLDAIIPPMVFFGVSLIVAALVTLVASLSGVTAPFFVTLGACALFVVSIFAAWLKFGREVLPARNIVMAPAYFLEKLRIYGSEGRQSAKSWTRTDRSNGS